MIEHGPLNRQVIREDIKKYILDEIIEGNFNPGQQIVETRIARKLGVSQAPVREAIRDLEYMGVLITKPYKGSYLRTLTIKDLMNVYDVRANIEGYAIKIASNNITEQEIKKLQDIYEEMKIAASLGNSKKQIELDISFHEIIIKASKNDVLERVWRIVSLAHWTYFGVRRLHLSLENLAYRHNEIIEALKDGNEEKAEAAMRNHFVELKNFLVSRNEETDASVY